MAAAGRARTTTSKSSEVLGSRGKTYVFHSKTTPIGPLTELGSS